MIVTRTPLRIPLGGGGTDLPSYYRRYGGFLISAAINRYVYIVVNRRFEDNIRVSYSQTEIVDRVEEIEHPIVRSALKLLNMDTGLEIISIADLPASTGLGSSSSFTVGLLHALHALKREAISPQDLAEEAFHIEVEVLGEPIGKQDQYLAAFGGVVCLEIGRDGYVRTTPLEMSDALIQEFEHSVILMYTGLKRSAAEVLAEESGALGREEALVTESLHVIKQIGVQVKEALESDNLNLFGELLDYHWQAKKQLSGKVSSGLLDSWYELAKEHGALGGKVMGAGGGGFFMFYCDNGDKARLRQVLAAQGLKELRFLIEPEGSKVLINL
ncbi:MAG TPA: hypothetical protein VJM69_02360 [Dehalococcoidia bacterium]|nr:hypothetical protein [Dehalococcoidia bacterium]